MADFFENLTIAVIGGVAGAVHLGKAKVRLLSTVSTGGLANPAVSVVEEGGAWSLALAALLVPIITAAILILLLVAVFWFVRQRRVRLQTFRPA